MDCPHQALLASQCLSRVDELDERLLIQQELLKRCQLEADRDALGELRLQMA